MWNNVVDVHNAVSSRPGVDDDDDDAELLAILSEILLAGV